jgi:hypothetical protein
MKRSLLLFSAVFCFLYLNSTAQVTNKSARAKTIKLFTGLFAGTSYNGNIIEGAVNIAAPVQPAEKYIYLTENVSVLFKCINAKTILHRVKDSFSSIPKDRHDLTGLPDDPRAAENCPVKN